MTHLAIDAGVGGSFRFAERRDGELMWLTMPALALTLLSGILLMLRRGLAPGKSRWTGAKLALVALIALKGTLVLAPTSRDIETAAQGAIATGGLPATFGELVRRKGVFGAVNLSLLLAVIGVAVVKPALLRTAIETHGQEAAS